MANAQRLAAREHDRLRDQPMAVEVQLDDVIARRQPEPLRHPVEVVNDADAVTVDVDLGIPRCDLDAGGAFVDHVAVRGRRVEAGISPAPTDAPEERVVEGCVVIRRDDHGPSTAMVPALRVRGRRHADDRDQNRDRNRGDAFRPRHESLLHPAGASSASKRCAATFRRLARTTVRVMEFSQLRSGSIAALEGA